MYVQLVLFWILVVLRIMLPYVQYVLHILVGLHCVIIALHQIEVPNFNDILWQVLEVLHIEILSSIVHLGCSL